ncbi:MAG: type II secretion system protein GspM [bacterium]
MAEQGRIGRLFETFDRLSTREKMLVGGLVTALFITAAVVIWLVIGRQISNLEERNKGLRETLAQVNEHTGRKRRLDAYQRRLEENDVKLVRLMESQATKLGITIEDFKENKRFITEKHRS